MRIGVDIDGVLNDFYGFLVDYGAKYSVEKNVSGMQDSVASSQTDMFGWDREIAREFWNEYALVETFEIPARTFASEVLQKLRAQGNEVYIITGRSNNDMIVKGMEGRSWEQITQGWLEKNNIIYDRIEFGLKNKAEFCMKEGVEVMIEDHPKFLQDFGEETKVLVYDALYNQAYNGDNLTRVYSWYDIYAKIKALRGEE